MNSFALLLVCFQACLVQSVFGQCLNRRMAIPTIGYEAGLAPLDYARCGEFAYPAADLAPISYATYGELAYPATAWAGGIGFDAYGGIGEGNVAVAGELPVAGSTAVAGQVPIMGAVKFTGPVCAAGTVSIAGKCARDCGCSSELPYFY